MKKLGIIACLTFAALLMTTGCGEKRRVAREANALVTRFVVLMDNGKTTRDQEQRFVRAIERNVFELDRAIRGTKKATATHTAAKETARESIGLPPKEPIAEPTMSAESILVEIEKASLELKSK